MTTTEHTSPPARDDPSVGRAEPTDLQQSLVALSALATGRLPLLSMLTQVAGLAVAAVPEAHGAGLVMFDDHRMATTVATAAFVSELDAVQYRLDQGPGVTAAAEACTVSCGLLATDPRWPAYAAEVAPFGVHSALSVPLLADGVVLGTVNLYARDEAAFDPVAVGLGELFAVPAAIAVHHAQLLAQTRRLATEMRNVVVGRSTVDRAIGILMHRSGISESAAIGSLRELSRGQELDLEVAAQFVVNEAALLARVRQHR